MYYACTGCQEAIFWKGKGGRRKEKAHPTELWYQLLDISIGMATQAGSGAPDMADDIEPMCRAGFFVRSVRGLVLDCVTVRNQVGEPFLMEQP